MSIKVAAEKAVPGQIWIYVGPPEESPSSFLNTSWLIVGVKRQKDDPVLSHECYDHWDIINLKTGKIRKDYKLSTPERWMMLVSHAQA